MGEDDAVRSTLDSAAVSGVLARLGGEGEARDSKAKERVRERQAQAADRPLTLWERAALYADAPIAVSAEVGELLYLLAIVRRAQAIVEFGTSLGVSAIYLAAAVRDLGEGSLISTELHPEKAERAQGNLAEAGLADLVEIRVGDAMETLAELDGEIDMLMLDGWNELYLPVLHLVEPHLAPDALVVADLSRDDPVLEPYLAYVRDERSAYFSTTLPLDAGVEVSVRLPQAGVTRQ